MSGRKEQKHLTGRQSNFTRARRYKRTHTSISHYDQTDIRQDGKRKSITGLEVRVT